MPSFNVSRDNSGEAWFRIGRLDVTSTLLLALVGAIGAVAATLFPTIGQALYLDPRLVLSGQVWRVFTWPFVDALSLWTILSLVLLWYFGRDLEAQIGRRSMGYLYLGMWASLTVLSLVLHLISGSGQMAGLGLVQFMVLLLWIAEYPQRPLFFGIRAWVIGAVLLGLQLVLMLAGARYLDMLTLLGSLLFTAILARRYGLLSDLHFLPGRRRTPTPSAPRPSRGERRETQRKASDAERIDELLEKISTEGIHSLTPAERRELEKLRQRRQSR